MKFLTVTLSMMIAASSFASDVSGPQGVSAPVAPVVTKTVDLPMLRAEEHNGDYVNRVQAPPSKKTINAFLFDREITDEMSAKYYAFSTSYEFKKKYRLDRREDHLQYEQANRELMDWTMMRMVQFHAENSLKNTDKSDSTGKAVSGAVSTVQAIQQSSLKLSEDTKAKFKYDLPRNTVTLGLNSPIVNTTAFYRMPTFTYRSNLNGQERAQVSIDRSIKPISAGAGVRYGLTQQTLNYGLTKKIVGPLSAGVDQSKKLSDHSRDETVGHLNLGFGF